MKKLFTFKVRAWFAIPILLLTFFWFYTTQTRGIASAQRHVQKITPEWEAFKADHPRLRKLKIGSGTAKNGCILIIGHVANENDYQKALQFIVSTDPPRPVDKWVNVFDDEEVFNMMYPLEGSDESTEE